MAEFTYNLGSSDNAIARIAAVRLELGDTVYGTGVKPDGSNFTDAEITYWLTQENDDVNGAVYRACSSLAKQWTNVANETVGPRKTEFGKVAGEWATRAKDLRPVDESTYVVKAIKATYPHDPYKYVPEDERQL